MEKLLNKMVSMGIQDITYMEIFELNGRKVKVEVKSDAFDFQCYARVKVLDVNNGWYVLYAIPYSEMKTRSGLYYAKDGKDEKYFVEDVECLKKMAKELLN